MILVKLIEKPFPRSSHEGTPKFKTWSFLSFILCPPRKLSQCGDWLKWEGLDIMLLLTCGVPQEGRGTGQKQPVLQPSHPFLTRTLNKALKEGAPWWPCLVFQVPSMGSQPTANSLPHINRWHCISEARQWNNLL